MTVPLEVGHDKLPYGSPTSHYSMQGYEGNLPDKEIFEKIQPTQPLCANRTISIRNLGEHVTGNMLAEHLSLAGSLERFDGPANGHVIATFRREEDAECAIRLLKDLSDKHYFLGRSLHVGVCRDGFGFSTPRSESCASEAGRSGADNVTECSPNSPVSPDSRQLWPNPLTVKAFVPSQPKTGPINSKTSPKSRRDSGKGLPELDSTAVGGTITNFPLVVNGSAFGKKGTSEIHEIS
jgi:hypothetical protein